MPSRRRTISQVVQPSLHKAFNVASLKSSASIAPASPSTDGPVRDNVPPRTAKRSCPNKSSFKAFFRGHTTEPALTVAAPSWPSTFLTTSTTGYSLSADTLVDSPTRGSMNNGNEAPPMLPKISRAPSMGLNGIIQDLAERGPAESVGGGGGEEGGVEAALAKLQHVGKDRDGKGEGDGMARHVDLVHRQSFEMDDHHTASPKSGYSAYFTPPSSPHPPTSSLPIPVSVPASAGLDVVSPTPRSSVSILEDPFRAPSIWPRMQITVHRPPSHGYDQGFAMSPPPSPASSVSGSSGSSGTTSGLANGIVKLRPRTPGSPMNHASLMSIQSIGLLVGEDRKRGDRMGLMEKWTEPQGTEMFVDKKLPSLPWQAELDEL